MTVAKTSRVWSGNESLRRLLVSVADLTAHPRNPRRGDVAAIQASLERFGQQRPILALPDGTVVAGNHTLRAAIDVGWTHIATVRSDLTDAEVEAYLLADNRTGDLGSYDDAALLDLLKPYYAEDALAGTGYERDDVKALLRDLARFERGDPDATPDRPTAPQSVRGEVYALGLHRVMCGDAFDSNARVTLVDRMDCLLTDPPYGINLDTDWRNSRGRVRGRKYLPMEGDDQVFDASEIVRWAAPAAEQFWFGANYYRRSLSESDRDGSWLVWDKRTEQTDSVVGSGFELIWSRVPHKQDLLRHGWTNYTSHTNAGLRRAHPTEKPVSLLVEIINRWTTPGAVVVDLFAGAGSTLIASESEGRHCLAMEIDPGYCDVIRQRYADYTGQLEYAP